jgi:hypothetical protein
MAGTTVCSLVSQRRAIINWEGGGKGRRLRGLGGREEDIIHTHTCTHILSHTQTISHLDRVWLLQLIQALQQVPGVGSGAHEGLDHLVRLAHHQEQLDDLIHKQLQRVAGVEGRNELSGEDRKG